MRMKIFSTAFTAILCSATMAYSDAGAGAGSDMSIDTKVIPEQVDGVPGLKPAGTILGRDAYASDRTDLVFMIDPDTGATIAGFPFDSEGNSLHPLPALAEMTLKEFISPDQAASNEDGVRIPQEAIPDIEEVLEKLDDKERQDAINELIAALRDVDVEDEEDFNRAVEGWIRLVEELGEHVKGGEDEAPGIVDASGSEAAELDISGPTFIEALGSAFTLDIGAEDAPIVYLVTDPLCGGCRDTWQRLHAKAEEGSILLKAVMIPAVNEDSHGTIAAILRSSDPIKVMDEVATKGAQNAPIARFHSLDQEIRSGIHVNIGIAETYRVPSLPLVAFTTAAGEAYLAGTPSDSQIQAATRRH